MMRRWSLGLGLSVACFMVATVSGCDLDQRPGVGTSSTPGVSEPADGVEPVESEVEPREGEVVVIIEGVVDSETQADLLDTRVVFGSSVQVWRGTNLQFMHRLENGVTVVELVAYRDGYEEARVPLDLSLADPVVRETVRMTPVPQEPEEDPEPVEPPPQQQDDEVSDSGPTEEMLVLQVTSEPSGATVTFRDSRGGGPPVASVTTPGQVRLPRRFYSWEIQRPGYSPVRSTDDLDLVTETPDNFHRRLTPVDVAARIQDGHNAFEAGNWTAAVQAYEQVPAPADLQTSEGQDYIFLQNRLGLSLLELQEPARAIEVFQGITRNDSRQWAAFLNLGRAQQMVGQCQDARRNLARVNGTLINSVPTAERPRVVGLVLHYTARCAVDEFDRTSDETLRVRWGALALGELTEFLNHMERTGVQDEFLLQAEQEAVSDRRRLEGALTP